MIAVVQSTQAFLRNYPTLRGGTHSACRRLLAEPKMRSVVMVIGNILGEQPLQMAFVQRDHVVEQLTAAAADPALSHTILPRTSNRGSHRGHHQRANRAGHLEPVFCVMIQYQELGSRLVRESFSELLGNPTAGRMLRDIDMHNGPPVVADDEEAVEHVKGKRRDGEEIHRRNRLTVIA